MKKIFSISILALSLLLSACGSSDSNDSGDNAQTVEFSAFFNPSLGLIPFPNDLYFAGTDDGTLNIPSQLGLLGIDALNALDGYSTNAPIKIDLNQAVDVSTLVGGVTAHLFEVTTDPATKAVIGFVGALAPGVDYMVGTSGASNGATTVLFTPLKPLNPKSSYLVALTNGVASTNGTLAASNTLYQSLKDAIASNTTLADPTLEQIRLFTGAHLAVLNALGVSSNDVLITASFSTQSTTDVLEAVAASAVAQASSAQQVFAAPGVPLSTNLIVSSLPGYADIYAGTVDTPYYLSKANPAGATAIPWQGIGGSNLTRFNPIPVPTETLTVPSLITIPNATSPWYQGFVAQTGITPEEAGYQWPLVIFQHGITGNRTNAIGIVDTYAAAGYAVISIDQPLHGIVDPTNPLYQAGNERTFDLDLDGDGVIDPSGSYTTNLENLLVGRDNNRQASIDLHHLAKTAPTIDINGDGNPDFDGSQMHFIGQSLGAIVGTPFLAVNTDVITGTLSVPGGGIAALLRDSESFGPVIEAGLVAQGLTPGTTLYEDFFRTAQTTIDAACYG